MNLPSGTLTFLFTDIEGSTALWERFPDAMRLALERHDAVLKAAIEAHNGYVFKTVGDAFCAAFPTAPDALHAALEAQLALLEQEWGETGPIRVRMGLHTGDAQERDNDYFGPTLNRVARLQGIGHGQQTLLSQATYELISACPAEASLSDLGMHRLKDLAAPEHVWQLLHPSLPQEYPPLKSLDYLPTNLPALLTSFIGREKELTEIKVHLAGTRLLTLTGSGGCGKTRLSIHVAADMLEDYPDGVWFVELAPLADPGLAPQAVAEALRVREVPGEPILGTLLSSLKAKRMLLVLDNCEHLLDACTALANALLRSCPAVSVLASSREVLNLVGESVYRVPSLSFPQPTQSDTPESLTRYEAVRLFLERAEKVNGNFTLTPQNAPAIASICHRLDGIPLAIELAAARVRSLTVEEINIRLDHRFRLLTGGNRSALPRHQTLRALIDWSYDLLTVPEKTLLQRLSLFAGGWTLEAAEQVCADENLNAWEVVEWLTALVDKSLVVFEEQDRGARYRLLETILEYSREKRLESEPGQALALRHRDFFLAMAQEAREKLRGPEQVATLNLVERDFGNVRAALDFCCKDGPSTVSGLRMASDLWNFYQFRGTITEGRRYLIELLSRPEASGDTEIRANALQIAGNMALTQGDLDQALRLYEESLTLRQAVGAQEGIANSLSCLALQVEAQGDFRRAGELLQESLTLYRALDDRRGIARTLGNLGMVAQDQGDFDTAVRFHGECLEMWRGLGDEHDMAITLGNLGVVAGKQGDFAQARRFFSECLASCLARKEKFITPYILEGLAAVFLEEPVYAYSAQLYGAAAALREEAGTPSPALEQAEIDAALPRLRMQLGDARFRAAYQAGQRLTLQEAIEYALQVAAS
ncbi:MAG TPA: tetratricopeptide repeat protein [Chthonomonadaceae bacterium]|nr:tetratricopeptide repeat protein [Chthonomonadaceae bacterium]